MPMTTAERRAGTHLWGLEGVDDPRQPLQQGFADAGVEQRLTRAMGSWIELC
jgi:hypothetical protein